jgi:hypothetical protein
MAIFPITILLLSIVTIAYAGVDVAGTTGMSGGALTTSSQTQQHVPFTASSTPTGSILTVTNDGNGKPYLIATSAAGPIRVVAVGSASSTCTYNQFTCGAGAVVYLMRTDGTPAVITQTSVFSNQGTVGFTLTVDQYAPSTATYAVFATTCQSSCSITISNAAFSATENVAVKKRAIV